MKKLSQTILVTLLILMLVAPQLVSALEIEVLPNGQVIFYQGSVLGDDDDDDNDDDDDRNEYREIIRTVNPWERKEIRVRTINDRIEVEIKDEDGEYRYENRFNKKETTEADGLSLRFPSGGDDQEVGGSANERIKSYKTKLLEERRGRSNELVELRNRIKNGEDEIEIRSRGATARLSSGASFVLDPNTKIVKIVTPSGQEHTLYHLPDQAILRMQEAGLLSLTAEGDVKDVEIEATEDGGLVYVVQDVERKRFLGIFRRDVPKEVELDDDTGEVTESPLEDRSLVDSFLDTLSF